MQVIIFERRQSSNYTISYPFTTGTHIRVAGVTWNGTLKAEHRSLVTIEEGSSENHSSSSLAVIAETTMPILETGLQMLPMLSLPVEQWAIVTVLQPMRSKVSPVRSFGWKRYLAADQLRQPWFHEVSASSCNLPAGAGQKGKGNSPHGHISIAENGRSLRRATQ